DLRIGGDAGSCFGNDLAVDFHLACENECTGALSRFGQTTVGQCDIQSGLDSQLLLLAWGPTPTPDALGPLPSCVSRTGRHRPRSFQFFRRTTQSAIAPRWPAVKPASASDWCARVRHSSASVRDRSTPYSATYVGFEPAASLPAVLPRSWALPSTS